MALSRIGLAEARACLAHTATVMRGRPFQAGGSDLEKIPEWLGQALLRLVAIPCSMYLVEISGADTFWPGHFRVASQSCTLVARFDLCISLVGFTRVSSFLLHISVHVNMRCSGAS